MALQKNGISSSNLNSRLLSMFSTSEEVTEGSYEWQAGILSSVTEKQNNTDRFS